MLLRKGFSALRRSRSVLRSYCLMAKSHWFMTSVSFQSRPYCGGNVYISCTDGGEIVIGKGVSFCANVQIIARGGRIEIGDNSHIGDGTLIVAKENIRIGKNALVAEYVVIRDQDHGLDSDPINNAVFTTAPIVIEENVWLAAKSTVLKGVNIGSGSVVSAHALVNKSVMSRYIVAGVPAKKVGVR